MARGRAIDPVSSARDALAKLAQEKPSLAASCDVLCEVLPVLFGKPVVETPPALDAAIAHDKLAAGIPLLRGEAVAIDATSLKRRWQAVCAVVERQNANAKRIASGFAELAPPALLSEVLAGRSEAVPARAQALGLDAALTATVLRLAMLPALAEFAAALESLCREVAWDHGSCPICGSWPLLAEFRGLEQNRFLRCGLCAADWPFARLRCPFCDTRDHRPLGFFHVEGEEAKHRAATCEQCHGYVKTLSTFDRLSVPDLLVADVATLHLDLAAADRGYFVP